MMDNEMKDLTARMAADEANEGNYAAAAELQKAARTHYEGDGCESRLTAPGKHAIEDVAKELGVAAEDIEAGGTGDVHLTPHQQLHGPVDDAPTGPLTPGQVECRVCRLDDRTRAASDPDDLLCNVCREDTPNRVRRERWSALRSAAAMFLGLEELEDIEGAEASAERDLINERIGALMQLAELVDGHMLPYKLVNVVEQACAPVTDGRESDADAARRFAGQCIELQKRVDELEANERTRKFVEKSLDRLKPQLTRRIATVIAPETEGMKAGTVILNPERETELVTARERAEAAARRLVEAGLRFVPTDAEIELAQKQLCYVIAGPDNIPGTPLKMSADWDGKVYMELSSELQESLDQCRESGYEDWGVFGLVRVPDEVVFGTEAGRG